MSAPWWVAVLIELITELDGKYDGPWDVSGKGIDNDESDPALA
jgi:hypothetical protein